MGVRGGGSFNGTEGRRGCATANRAFFSMTRLVDCLLIAKAASEEETRIVDGTLRSGE